MWRKIDNYTEKYEMLSGVGRIVIGLSGGADSVCLARYLLKEKDKYGYGLHAVHVNHMLRGEEADRDEGFVRDFCSRWGIPLTVFRRDVQRIADKEKLSTEEAGRRVRYACFRQVLDNTQYDADIRMEKDTGTGKKDYLAVAHHADDQAETMLFRMARGTGPKGMAAIRPVQGAVIRPLLGIRKKEIYEILRKLGQDYVEDSTNREEDYSRNYIRHRIIKDLEQINPQAVDHLCSLAMQQADLLDFAEVGLKTSQDKVIGRDSRGYVLDIDVYKELMPYARQETMRRLLFMAAGRERDIGSVHVEQLMDLAANLPGKRLDLPYGLTAVRQEEVLTLRKRSRGEPAREDLCIPISLPDFEEGKSWSIPLPDGYVLKCCCRQVDAGSSSDKLLLPASARSGPAEFAAWPSAREEVRRQTGEKAALESCRGVEDDPAIEQQMEDIPAAEQQVEDRPTTEQQMGDRPPAEQGAEGEPETGQPGMDGQSRRKKDCVGCFDYDTINHNLCLRTRREGDYFLMNRFGRHKRLNRYFIDRKVPGDQRDRQWLLAEDSHILWVLGNRVSEACKVTSRTSRVLIMTCVHQDKDKERTLWQKRFRY